MTYVQRLATSGGAPPLAQAGVRIEVPYEAMYAFYVADTKSK